MKRITQGSTTSLNDPAFESFKPLYGTKGNPPFYDPNDLHSHVWKKGKLGIEENPKIPTFTKGKLNIKDCIYCKICHITKDSFQSSVGNNRDIVDDIIQIKQPDSKSEYIIIEPNIINDNINIQILSKQEIIIPKNINQKLFHNQEGIFNNYIEVVNKETEEENK